MYDFLAYASVTLLMLVSILLIFIVLLQRGRGGGLAGALGGAGGQSALGTKAGDVFTKITVGLAAIWILSACLSIYALRWAVESATAGFSEDKDATATETESPDVSGTGETSSSSAAAGSGPGSSSLSSQAPLGDAGASGSTPTDGTTGNGESAEGPALVPPTASETDSAAGSDSAGGEQ